MPWCGYDSSLLSGFSSIVVCRAMMIGRIWLLSIRDDLVEGSICDGCIGRIPVEVLEQIVSFCIPDCM